MITIIVSHFLNDWETKMVIWKEGKLKDFAEVKGGKRLPKGQHLISKPNSHPYIRIRDLGKSKILELTNDYEYVDDVTQKTIARYTVTEGDLLISVVGTIGLIAIVGRTLNGANQTENCDKIINIKNLDRDYLYYYLVSSLGQEEIKKGTVGAVQPKLPLKNVQDLTIRYPDFKTQKKIASFLGSLDYKIEVNRAINRNLAATAQAIYQSWFVDYEPWGGNIPTYWIRGRFGDFVEVKRGGSPRPIQDFISNSGYRWLKISDVTSVESPFILSIKEHIKKEGIKKTVLLKPGALVLSNSATPGIPKILDVETCIHDGWLYFPKKKLSNEFLYLFFLDNHDGLVSLGNGSVFTNLKTDILKGFPIAIPDQEALQKFDSLVQPCFTQMRELARENRSLSVLRDSLLPKLMSGELDVSKLEL